MQGQCRITSHLGELEDALRVSMLIGAPHLAHHQVRHILQDRPVHKVQRVRLAVAQHPARHVQLVKGMLCLHNITL